MLVSSLKPAFEVYQVLFIFNPVDERDLTVEVESIFMTASNVLDQEIWAMSSRGL